MTRLKNNIILEFHSDTLEEVRKVYNLHKQKDMSEAINILQQWVQQQNHLTKKDFCQEYLERSIISSKGSVERAKKRIDKICRARTLMPKYFGDFDMRHDFKKFYETVTMAPLPKLTKDNYRVLMLRNEGQKFESTFLLQLARCAIVGLEYLKANDYSNGFIVVFDNLTTNWTELISKLNVVEMQETLSILLGGYDSRVSGIHVLSNSNLISWAINFFKMFLSKKMGDRIHAHNTKETLQDFVSKDILPLDYGGEEKSLATLHENVVDVLSLREQRNYMREMCNARTNESLRQSGTFNDAYIGTPGTFRTLNVD